MRKLIKIGLVLLSVFIMMLATLYFFRNPIIASALQKVVSSKSGQKIVLEIPKVNFDPLHGTIALSEPSLRFTDFYLGENKAMKMEQLSFGKLGVYDVSVFSLLFEKQFIADKILVLKPMVHFEKVAGTQSDTNRFTAKKLMGLLNTESTAFTGIKMKINEVEISFGTIHLQSDTIDKYVPDLLDFTLLLKQFETQIAANRPTENRILYSGEVIFRVKNINKRLESGYDLQIDSVSYNSKTEKLIGNGMFLKPLWEEGVAENKAEINIPLIEFNGFGISEIRGIDKLHLDAIKISGTRLTRFNNKIQGQTSPAKTDSSPPGKLPGLFENVTIDSLIVSDFTFYNVLSGYDTTLAVNTIELLMEDIAFDSTLPVDPMKNLQFGNVHLSSSLSKLFETEKGVTASYLGFAYSSAEKQLEIDGLRLQSDSLLFKGPQFAVELPVLRVNGFSVADFLQKRKQLLGLNLKQPRIQVNLQNQKEPGESSPNNRNAMLELLDFQNFSIEQGSLRLSKGKEFNVDLNGVNLLVDGLKFPDNDSVRQLKYDTLHLAVDAVEASLADGNTSLKTEKVVLNKQFFEISNLQAGFNRKVEGKWEAATISLRRFRVQQPNLNSLYFDKQFQAASVLLDAPVFRGNMLLPDSAVATDKEVNTTINLPVGFQIGEFVIRQGKVDVVLEKSLDTIYLQTDFDLSLGEINSNDSSFLNWISPADWEAAFHAVALSTSTYNLNVDAISLNARQSDFVLNQMVLVSKPHPKHFENKLELERLNLPRVQLSGLNYALLLLNDSLRFSKLFVDQPELNIRLFKPETGKHSPSESSGFSTEELMRIVYDTIDLNGLQLNITKSSDSSHEIIRVGGFSLEHFADKQTDGNLMPEIEFQLDEFSIEDTLNNFFLHMCTLEFNPRSMALAIHNIDWSQIKHEPGTTLSNRGRNIDIHTSEIIFSGAFVKEAIPSQLKFDKLTFSGLDIFVTDGNKTKSARKKELEFDVNALKKYSGLLSRFTIDTTIFDNVSVHYRTFDASKQSTIQVDSIGLVVNRINVDTSMFDQTNPLLLNNIVIDLKGRTRISKDSLYEVQTGRIHYNFPERRITVDSFYVLPRFSEAESFRRAKYQKGIINLFAEKAEFSDLRIDELLNDKLLHFGGVEISGLRFNIVKDKKYPIKPGTYKPMPQDMIRNIDQKITIDSVSIVDSYLYFKLFPEKKSNIPGQIFLDNMNVKAYHFTNASGGDDSVTLKIALSADIMGESRMDANFYFPLQDTSNSWWFSFKTEEIDFTKLNSMTRQLVGLNILRGKGRVDVPHISGDNFNTSGTLIFRYKKLRLSLYNRKKAETETNIFNSMANFLINDLVIKSNNPKFARRPKVGVVYTERNTQKAIVNYAFKSVLSGMLSTLGINKKEQRKERREYKKEEKQSSWKSF